MLNWIDGWGIRSCCVGHQVLTGGSRRGGREQFSTSCCAAGSCSRTLTSRHRSTRAQAAAQAATPGSEAVLSARRRGPAQKCRPHSFGASCPQPAAEPRGPQMRLRGEEKPVVWRLEQWSGARVWQWSGAGSDAPGQAEEAARHCGAGGQPRRMQGCAQRAEPSSQCKADQGDEQEAPTARHGTARSTITRRAPELRQRR